MFNKSTFSPLSEAPAGTADHRETLKKAKKGDPVTFTHHKHGEITGTYGGQKRLGAHSYTKVHAKGHGLFYLPHHTPIKHTPKEEPKK